MNSFRGVRMRGRGQLRRRGFNLIELLAVMSVIGALLSLSASVLSKAGMVHLSAVKAVAQLRLLTAIQNRIRYDTGMSIRVDTPSEDSVLLTREASLAIRYRVVDSAVVREVLDSGNVTGTERWRFSISPELHFELIPSSSPVTNGHPAGHTGDLPHLQMNLMIPDVGGDSKAVVTVARVGCQRFTAPSVTKPIPSEASSLSSKP